MLPAKRDSDATIAKITLSRVRQVNQQRVENSIACGLRRGLLGRPCVHRPRQVFALSITQTILFFRNYQLPRECRGGFHFDEASRLTDRSTSAVKDGRQSFGAGRLRSILHPRKATQRMQDTVAHHVVYCPCCRPSLVVTLGRLMHAGRTASARWSHTGVPSGPWTCKRHTRPTG